jgi:enoyl-CoA hydratase
VLPAAAFENAGWIRAIQPEADLGAIATEGCRQLADRSSPAQHRLKTLLHSIDGVAREHASAEELTAFAGNRSASSAADALRALLASRIAKADTQ